MSAVLAAVLDVLATYRLTRLVVADTLTETPRLYAVLAAYDRAQRPLPVLDHLGGFKPTGNEIVEADDDPPKLAYLVTCPWCSGFYVAIGVTIARAALPRAWGRVARALALSAAAGLLARSD